MKSLTSVNPPKAVLNNGITSKFYLALEAL